jgi:hypothetical protein
MQTYFTLCLIGTTLHVDRPKWITSLTPRSACLNLLSNEICTNTIKPSLSLAHPLEARAPSYPPARL